MNALQESYKGFVLLAFPCNQFGLQEPGANGSEIMNALKYIRPGGGFEPNFPMFEKIEVNGENEHPLYTYLKTFCPSPMKVFAPPHRVFYKPQFSSDIRWNFEKFLIDKRGKPVTRYTEMFHPDEIRQDIQHLLQEPDFSQ
jgi:glutathione peroxidase